MCCSIKLFRVLGIQILIFLVVHAASCITDENCNLNGFCSNGNCVCDKGWTGPDCGALNQLPGEIIYPNQELPPNKNKSLTASTWGGSIIRAEEDGKYHLLVDVVCSAITENHEYNAVIAHAVGDSIEGPFYFKEVTLSASNINPHIIRAQDGTYLLYHYHLGPKKPDTPCTGQRSSNITDLPTAEVFYAPGATEEGEYPAIASSKSLYGPWTIHKFSVEPKTTWDTSNCNPAPLQLQNGSILLVFTATFYNPTAEHLGIAIANHWTDETYRVLKVPIWEEAFAEDASLYKTNRGFHIIFHYKTVNFDDTPLNPNSGGHAYSKDMINWQLSTTIAYNTTVPLKTGAISFIRRERPEVHVIAGNVAYLVSGVERIYAKGEPSKTVIVPLK